MADTGHTEKQAPLVLTIDDEPSIRMVFRLYLEEFGYRVIEVDGLVDNIKMDLDFKGFFGSLVLRF